MGADEGLKGNELRDMVISIAAQIGDLQKKRDELLARLRDECTHEALIETPFMAACAFWHATPPQRICVICGLIEEGWGSGYKKLNKGTLLRVVKDRNEFRRYRELKPLATTVIPEDMKGKI